MTRKAGGVIAKREQAFPPTVVEQLQGIERDLGGRAAVVGMLALAPLTPDLRYLLGLLGDPTHQTRSLAEICTMARILPGTLLQQLASATLLTGKVRANQKISQGIAAVVEDVMKRGAPYEDTCGECLGAGMITPDPTPQTPNPTPERCQTCRGTGRLVYQPELERQKLAIEMAQLLPKGGGVNIAVQQNNTLGAGAGMGGGLLDRLQTMSDQVLYGGEERAAPTTDFEPEPAAPLDGEVLSSPDPDV